MRGPHVRPEDVRATVQEPRRATDEPRIVVTLGCWYRPLRVETAKALRNAINQALATLEQRAQAAKAPGGKAA